MKELNTRQQASRSGRARRLTDPVAQQKALRSMGVEVSVEVLRTLPPGGWVRFAPDGEPLWSARKRPG
ncbi:MAG: hypothetical protein JWQ97_3656 [Phenylobacterium sp.]|nr:hypothetical protein [Phenylobacterium sp.]